MKFLNQTLSSIFAFALISVAPLPAHANQAHESHSQKTEDTPSINIGDLSHENEMDFVVSKSYDHDSFLGETEGKKAFVGVENKNSAYSWNSPKHKTKESHSIIDSGSEKEHEMAFDDSFKNKDYNHFKNDDHHEHGLFDGDGEHHLFDEEDEHGHIQPVPEPATNLLMLFGLLLIAFVVRQRRQI